MYIHVDVYIFILMLKMRTYHILLHIHSHTVFYLWWSIKCMIEIYTSKDKKKNHTKHLDFTYFEHWNLFNWRAGLIKPDIPCGQFTFYLNNSR